MLILSATGIKKSYGVNTILSNVSFHINKGQRIGIIGDNGAGKTTLLSILAGELSCDQGNIFLASNISLGYLRQQDNFQSHLTIYDQMLLIFSDLLDMEREMTALSEEIASLTAEGKNALPLLQKYDELSSIYKNRNGYGYESEIRGILYSMGFPESTFGKSISSLSGGERTRLALASLLLQKPDLLLLDEPTNHLDIGTLKWLEQYLKNYSGTLVVISHDRYFLDQTVTRIFEIEHHSLYSYNGNYSSYLKKKSLRMEQEMRNYQQKQNEIRRQEEMIRRLKQHGTEKLAKRAHSREKRLERMELPNKPRSKGSSLRLQFKENFISGNDVIFAQDLSKSFLDIEGRRQLFKNVGFDVKRGQRVCIVGPNGIGKTTLLKIIMGVIDPDTGMVRLGHNVEFAYYEQRQELLTGGTVLDELHNSFRLYDEPTLRNILSRFLFRNDDVFKDIKDLSGGEKARIALLKIMMSGANLLVMDEPTNHLDIGAKEAFEDALLDFPGTVIMVSHDRYLLNKVPTHIYELTENGIDIYPGGYDYYLEKKQDISSGKEHLNALTELTATESLDPSHPQPVGLTAKEERQLQKATETALRKNRRDIKACEGEITALEEKIKELENEMCHKDLISDYETLTQKGNELNRLKEALNREYERWESLQYF
jgi:ATP-binding cassette subfamily F protein 3